ncbi:MAG TPA: hypothetical protein VHM27_13420, partial [Rhizomicrobium sp.]|nr:hypothetical protein [Rhizomicrobium sp.]
MASLIRDRAAASAGMLSIFGDAALLRHACAFEAALARAQAGLGLITAAEADAIASACARPPDSGVLAEEAAHAGTLAIALLRHLRQAAGASGSKMHLGATSQDLADTVLV